MKYLSALFMSLVVLCACATNTGDATKDRRARVANALMKEAARTLGKFAVQSLKQAALNEIDDSNSDAAAMAADALRHQSTPLVTGAQVQNIVNAWSGEKDFQRTASTAKREVDIAIANGVPRKQAVEAVAAVVEAASIHAGEVLPAK